MNKQSTNSLHDIELRRHAELYVLSRVGRCTDSFKHEEAKYAFLDIKPIYERNNKHSLAKVTILRKDLL